MVSILQRRVAGGREKETEGPGRAGTLSGYYDDATSSGHQLNGSKRSRTDISTVRSLGIIKM